MFLRVVNLLTFKMAVFQGRRGKGTRRFHPPESNRKTLQSRCNFRTYPQLSGVIRGSGPQKSEPIPGSENRNPDLSAAIRSYPNLSEASLFFSSGSQFCPRFIFPCHPGAVQSLPDVSPWFLSCCFAFRYLNREPFLHRFCSIHFPSVCKSSTCAETCTEGRFPHGADSRPPPLPGGCEGKLTSGTFWATEGSNQRSR